jgi:peptide/nickel transport system ATP-binding protein
MTAALRRDAAPVAAPAPEPLVSVEGLTVRFKGGDGSIAAVNGVDFTLERGKVLTILGESGSGKSVTLKAMMRLHPARKTTYGGRIMIGGRNILALSERELVQVRGSVVSMIFQEPMLAFDPVYTIGHQIAETVVRHEGVSRRDADKRALDLLEMVQIPSAARRLKAYPHEMSGGMRQRAMIALALSCRPDLLLAD